MLNGVLLLLCLVVCVFCGYDVCDSVSRVLMLCVNSITVEPLITKLIFNENLLVMKKNLMYQLISLLLKNFSLMKTSV